MVSIRIIRVLTTAPYDHTVDVEVEGDDMDELLLELGKSETGKRILKLVDEAFADIEAFTSKTFTEKVKAEEEKLRQEGRDALIKELKKKVGLDVNKILPKEEDSEVKK